MSQGFHDDINQGLQKIGHEHSNLDEKQQQMVQMIKRMEVHAQINCHVNQNIEGLRKKRVPFSAKPSTLRWWDPFHSFERNGLINFWLAKNWIRLVFPIVPAFFFMYICQPILHGTVYIKHYNNFQWESLYFKFGTNRHLYSDQTITRLA